MQNVSADPGLPESVRGVRVSPSFFRMLGVDAAIGRTFADDEAVPGHDRVASCHTRCGRGASAAIRRSSDGPP